MGLLHLRLVYDTNRINVPAPATASLDQQKNGGGSHRFGEDYLIGNGVNSVFASGQGADRREPALMEGPPSDSKYREDTRIRSIREVSRYARS